MCFPTLTHHEISHLTRILIPDFLQQTHPGYTVVQFYKSRFPSPPPPTHPSTLASVSLVRQFAAPFLYQFIIKDITEGTEEEMHTGGGRERSVERLCPHGHSTRQAAHTVVGYVEALRTHSFWIFNTDMMGYIIAQW